MTNNNWFLCILFYCKSNIDTGKIPSLKNKVYVSFNVINKIIKCLLFSLNIVCSIFFYKAGNFTPEMLNVIYSN